MGRRGGEQSVTWDGRNDYGDFVPAGSTSTNFRPPIRGRGSWSGCSNPTSAPVRSSPGRIENHATSLHLRVHASPRTARPPIDRIQPTLSHQPAEPRESHPCDATILPRPFAGSTEGPSILLASASSRMPGLIQARAFYSRNCKTSPSFELVTVLVRWIRVPDGHSGGKLSLPLVGHSAWVQKGLGRCPADLSKHSARIRGIGGGWR
jgi:hypothetical protein